MAWFTEEEIKLVKSVDLVDLAESVHIPLKRKGRYYSVDGMDSVIIFNRSTWYRYSRGIGGSTIDFLMYFKNMSCKEAITYLLDYVGYKKSIPVYVPDKEKKCESRNQRTEFHLPIKSQNSRGLYAYLMKCRMLSSEIIRYWIKNGLMYESEPYHNIVFLGKNKEGVVKFASQRGIRDRYGKIFKGDVPGNDKRYGVNLIHTNSQELNVYEAAIDAMSDMDFRNDYKTGILALGMVSDGPLQTILEEYPKIKRINFCLDNDLPGRIAAKKLAGKYVLAGYEVFLRLPPFGKDYNCFLQCEREMRRLRQQWNRLKCLPERNIKEPERKRQMNQNNLDVVTVHRTSR